MKPQNRKNQNRRKQRKMGLLGRLAHRTTMRKGTIFKDWNPDYQWLVDKFKDDKGSIACLLPAVVVMTFLIALSVMLLLWVLLLGLTLKPEQTIKPTIKPISTVVEETAKVTPFSVEEEIKKYIWLSRGRNIPNSVIVALAKAENGYAMNGDSWKYDAQYFEADGTVSTGIFMINSVHRIPEEKLFDPEFNIEYANEYMRTNGIERWGAYTDGNYLDYL